MRRPALLLLALSVVLSVPGTAVAESQTANAGSVSATISWTPRAGGGPPDDFHVTIARDGTSLVDEPMSVDACRANACAGLGPGIWPTHRRAVGVVDLDGGGEPEVVVDAYTAGAHCCTVTKIWRFVDGAYVASEQDWGNQWYSRTDLNRDGKPEFISADDRFTCAFGEGCAAARNPVLVMTYRAGVMRDVTRRFPAVVRRDLARQKRYYRQVGGRPAIAAYVADLHRLGHHREARRVLLRALRRGELDRHSRYEEGPFGRAFMRELNRMLRAGGYLT